MTEAVIVGAVRTPMGRHQGALKDVRPDDLGALVVGEVVRRAGVDAALVDEVCLCCANLTAWETTLGWRVPNPRLKAQYGNDSMGETAENLRELDPQISREDQDRFALESHRRAIAAMESGRFAEEIVPVPIPQKGGGSL